MSAGKPERSFFDTNVLVYADDLYDAEKNRRACQLIQEHLCAGTGAVSTQVLAEYFVNVTRKFKLNVDPREARRKIELLTAFDVVSLHKDDIIASIDLSQKHKISFWDALVVRAARQAGCRYLLTEDLQHGQVIECVEIVNPFL